MNPSSKRKDPPNNDYQNKKRQWRTPKKNQSINTALTINPGDAGIWATCDMHKEGKATAELRDLFEEYAVKMYGEDSLKTRPDEVTNVKCEGGEDGAGEGDMEEQSGVEMDIEAEIASELQDIKNARSAKSGSSHQPLFQAVKIDVQCVLFFKTRAPVDPVDLVSRICDDAFLGKSVRRSRCVKRLTPMTKMAKANVDSLDTLARDVLGPVFHPAGKREERTMAGWAAGKVQGDVETFAIRPTIRNHSTMKRDDVIKQIAQIVGPEYRVDLKNYDALILVDIYRNIMGMSIVGSRFEELKRFNLAEIYDPTPQPGKAEAVKPDAAGVQVTDAAMSEAVTLDSVVQDAQKKESFTSDAAKPDTIAPKRRCEGDESGQGQQSGKEADVNDATQPHVLPGVQGKPEQHEADAAMKQA